MDQVTRMQVQMCGWTRGLSKGATRVHAWGIVPSRERCASQTPHGVPVVVIQLCSNCTELYGPFERAQRREM